MLLGYARTSTSCSAVSQQIRALSAAGCERIYADTTKLHVGSWPELERAIGRLGDGDTLVVTALDRIGPRLSELLLRVRLIQSRGASLRALVGAVDTNTVAGRELIETLASLDRFDTGSRIQLGMQAAQHDGRHVGRPRLLEHQQVHDARLRELAGEPVSRIAREFGVSAQTLRRALRTATQPQTDRRQRA